MSDENAERLFAITSTQWKTENSKQTLEGKQQLRKEKHFPRKVFQFRNRFFFDSLLFICCPF
jgi:hypothetical protein